MKQTLSVSLSNETLYFFKELIQHHLSYAVEHPLPDTGYQSSHLRIRAVFKYRLAVVLRQINRHIALHKARATRTFAAENIMRWRLFLLDGNLAFVSSFNRSNANFHVP